MKFKTLKSCFSKEMLLKCCKDFTNFDRIICYIHNEGSRKKRKTKLWELLSNNPMFLKNCWWLSFLCSSHLVGHATLVLLGRGAAWLTKWGLQQWLYLSGMISFKNLKINDCVVESVKTTNNTLNFLEKIICHANKQSVNCTNRRYSTNRLIHLTKTK